MRVQAEPSDLLVKVDGTLCRVWNAVTENGEQIFLFVARTAVPSTAEADLRFFDEHGIETESPTIVKAQN